MFHEEKLPVAAQNSPMPQRFIEVNRYFTDSAFANGRWGRITPASNLTAACWVELLRGHEIIGFRDDGTPLSRGVPHPPSVMDDWIPILQCHGWQLDSEWTDSIGRHARMVTTQPRGE